MPCLLLTCEHASHAVPPGVDLGLTETVLRSHVSTDHGAGDIARSLAEFTGASLHLGRFSRLVVDLNRRASNPRVIAHETYGIEVPGNVGLSDVERAQRIETWHRPYRAAALADALSIASSGLCLHLSMHSFDPAVDPANRDFDVGVLFDTERSPEAEIAAQINRGLNHAGWRARLNEPYKGTPEGLTSWLRAQIPARSYVGLEIECSYRWVDDGQAVERFVRALANVIGEL